MSQIKHRRQEVIRHLVKDNDVSSQADLRERLGHFGFEVTQATVSRDLQELGVVKIVTPGGMHKYAFPAHQPAVESIEVSGNLLVLKTEAGMAPMAAYRIDAMELPDLLGTVAGEDTLLVVAAEGADPDKLKDEIWKRLQSR
ncbi:MAG: arginine repressor [Acidobacteriota bacterium]